MRLPPRVITSIHLPFASHYSPSTLPCQPPSHHSSLLLHFPPKCPSITVLFVFTYFLPSIPLFITTTHIPSACYPSLPHSLPHHYLFTLTSIHPSVHQYINTSFLFFSYFYANATHNFLLFCASSHSHRFTSFAPNPSSLFKHQR